MEKPDLERIAARVDEDDGAADGLEPLDEESRRTLEEMRELRDLFRADGRVEAPPGMADRVLARVAKDREQEKVVVLARRRERRLIWLQAASLAALCLAYGALFAGSRVKHVGPRWDETKSAREPAATAAADPAEHTRVALRLSPRGDLLPPSRRERSA